VVLENTELKRQIKDLIEENDKLKTQIDNLKELNQSLASQSRQRASIISRYEAGPVSHRDFSRVFDHLDISELDVEKHAYDNNLIMDMKKVNAIKEDFPDIYADKLLKSYQRIEKEYLNTLKEHKRQKKELNIFKEKYRIKSNEFSKLARDYEKWDNKRKKLEAILNSGGGGGGTGTPFYENVRSEGLEDKPHNTIKKKVTQNAYDIIKNIKSYGNSIAEEKDSHAPQFQDISSILMNPGALKNPNESSEEIEDNSNILDDVIDEDENESEV